MDTQTHQSDAPAQPLSPRSPDRPARASGKSTNGLSVRVREESTSTVVTLAGRLNLITAEEFDCVLWDTQRNVGRVVIDLRALEFIDSAGIHSLLGAQLRASSWMTHLEVICAGGRVQRLLALTGADQLINVTAPVAPLDSLPTYTPGPMRRL